MKVAVLYICTGKYNVFWKEFYLTSEKNFLPNSEKSYFVFTDDNNLFGKENPKVQVIPHKFMGWPYDTLMRFEVFWQVKEELQKFDYVFFFNANMIFAQKINENDFLKLDNPEINLIMIQHPGAYNKKAKYVPYCRDKKSTAYIPYHRGKKYVMGALNGGKAKYYLDLIETLHCNTRTDLDKNVIATVHDESHLNRYVLDRQDVWIHTPEYCNAETYPDLPFDKKIVMLDKSKYFDVDKLKGNVNQGESKMARFIRRAQKWFRCNVCNVSDRIKNTEMN